MFIWVYIHKVIYLYNFPCSVRSLLYCTEAWSGLKLKDIKILEKVDLALIKSLVKGHPKCPAIFYYLETGTLMLRHILTINRLMFHHHILSRDKEETISKIYYKQKDLNVKGDWFNLLMEDFNFIGEKMNEEEIMMTSKPQYKHKIKELVTNAAFNLYKK